MLWISSNRQSVAFSVAACFLLAPLHLLGEDTNKGPMPPPPAAAAKGGEKKEKPDFPPFDKFAKDHKEISAPEGSLWKLYYNKKTDNLLAVIPSGMMNKNFLMATSIAGGPMLAGYMWGDQLVQWREIDKKLVLVEPDVRHKTGKGSDVEDVIKRTYTESIVLSTPIVSKKDGSAVIDLDRILKSDYASLGRIFGGSIDASLSRYAKRKVFPKNLELAVDLAVMQGNRGGIRARVHYSISELPENDYKPREADDRVGFFLTAVKDWTAPHNAKTVFKRYINRWRLRKEDPSAKVSDVNPDDQIVFYIEKTVPKKYRRFVREGILEWNKAFEAAGLRNAIQVRQQTATNEFKDLDPEDVRYNFFRWIVSGRAFAMGPSRANPLTGQILDADIIWDDALTRSFLAQYARSAAQGPSASYDPQLSEFLSRYPEWNFQSLGEALLPVDYQVSGVNMNADHELQSSIGPLRAGHCNCAEGIAHEMCMGMAMLDATGSIERQDEFIGQFIRYVVTHEVGHTMGLRHNFKGSSWKSVEQILGNKDEHAPTCGSVMDYNTPLFAANPEDQNIFVSSAAGPYDLWAIEYGYRTTDDEFSSEEELRTSITSRCAEPGLAYATDEDTMFFAPDPLVNRWDTASCPIEFAKQRLAMVKQLQANIEGWAVKEGESYNELRKTFDLLLFEIGRASSFAARYVGGQYVSRDHKGDPDARDPFVIVSVEKQRESLNFLIEKIYAVDAFNISPELLNKLAAGRWGHWDTDSFDSMIDYPIHDRIAAAQYWSLFHLLNPATIGRVYDAEAKVPSDEDALTVPELMGKVAEAIWSEVADAPGSGLTNRKPYINSIRRNLQRRHLEVMINVVLSDPGRVMPADAHAIARMTLKKLSSRIGEALEVKAKLDDFSHAHLDESKARIDKALEAEFSL